MKRKTWLLFVFVCFTVFSLVGCVSAGIDKPELPMKEQCVINMLDGLTINGSGVGSTWSVHRSIIPAGDSAVKVKQNKYYTVSKHIDTTRSSDQEITTIYETYIKYVEFWECNYKFNQGKIYHAEVKYATIGYNGKTLTTNNAGVVIKFNNNLKIYEVYHNNPDDIEITESNTSLSGGMLGTTYFGPYTAVVFTPAASIDYGPSFGNLEIGPRFGLQIIRNNFSMMLNGEGSAGFGTALPDFNNLGVRLGYNYGGLVEFHYKDFGIGFGGGMAGGMFSVLSKEDMPDMETQFFYSFPYAKFDIFLPGSDNFPLKTGLSFKYYFNDQDWYNRFGINWYLRFI